MKCEVLKAKTFFVFVFHVSVCMREANHTFIKYLYNEHAF